MRVSGAGGGYAMSSVNVVTDPYTGHIFLHL